jgi:hypothetical protein
MPRAAPDVQLKDERRLAAPHERHVLVARVQAAPHDLCVRCGPHACYLAPTKSSV